jgi:pyrroline-5-carboxylate reductase
MTGSSTTQTQAGHGKGAETKKKIALLGCGKMGTILLESFLERKLVAPQEAIATVQHGDRGPELSRELGGVPVGTDNRAAVAGAQIVLLCVKPQVLGQLLDEIAPALTPETLVISIAASTTTSFIQQKLGKDIPVVRAMPNTPAMVGAAMTAVCAGPVAKPEHVETAKHLFESVGRALIVDEKHMDAITALSASGPAFVFVILESLAEAGVKVCLPREMATTLAAQTL